jgi:hypothetical protein
MKEKYMMWFPRFHQIVFGRRNESWLNSVWVGVFLPWLIMPTIIWRVFLMSPSWLGVKRVLFSMVCLPVAGLLGLVDTDEITLQDAHLKALQRILKRPKSDV